MVLYDADKKLLAINEQTLETLGYNSLEEFKKEVYDIAQLFVKRAGYIHEFRSFHWIDYVLTNSTITHRAILRTKDQREMEVFLKVNQLNSLRSSNIFYLVTFELNTFNECLVPESESSFAQAPKKKAPKPSGPQKIEIKPKEFPEPNLKQISEELNLGEDIVLDFLKEFVNHALEKLPKINSLIQAEDKRSLYHTIHTLKGVAANLRLHPALNILSSIKRDSSLEEMQQALVTFYSYILFLAKYLDIPIEEEKIFIQNIAPKEPTPQEAPKQPSQEQPKEKKENITEAAKEIGLSINEYQEYLKELINEIKLNLAYNNFNELHKLASFARNLYLQECAKYLDQVNINQNPQLVQKCIQDLEELKKEPNPFTITLDDLKESLKLIQIDKNDFIDIIEDLIIELKTLQSIKMKREKFIKKAKQLKSVAESLRLSNLVLLLTNIITNYPLDKHMSKQLEDAIVSLETNIKQI